jgi:hypothetical protein
MAEQCEVDRGDAPNGGSSSFLRGRATGAKHTPPFNDAEDTDNEFLAQ